MDLPKAETSGERGGNKEQGGHFMTSISSKERTWVFEAGLQLTAYPQGGLFVSKLLAQK
jgi:hypothetical protein